MKNTPKHLILVVDDDHSIREIIAILLRTAGYDVRTASNGFDALLQLKNITPAVIISDLNMPQMSGFEFLSVVRRRFPEIPVLAASGAYEPGDDVPCSVIADAFYAKGAHPKILLDMVAELIRTATLRAVNHQHQAAPVWIPLSGRDAEGMPFIVLTCAQCLRSFPMNSKEEGTQEVQRTSCLFCGSPVQYVVDYTVIVSRTRAAAAGG